MFLWCAIIAVSQIALVPTWGAIGAAWGVLVSRLIGLALLAVSLFATLIHLGGARKGASGGEDHTSGSDH